MSIIISLSLEWEPHSQCAKIVILGQYSNSGLNGAPAVLAEFPSGGSGQSKPITKSFPTIKYANVSSAAHDEISSLEQL